MADNILVIISSGEEAAGKAMTGMRFAYNAAKNKWLNDVRIILFGPSEKLATTNQEFASMLKDAIKDGIIPNACSGVATKENITEKLVSLGLSVDPIGPIVSSYIKKGYEVITF